MSESVKINLDECDDVMCSKKGCDNGLFLQGFTLKRVPGLMIAQPKDKIVNVAQMICTVCGTVYDTSKGAKQEKDNLIVKGLKAIAK